MSENFKIIYKILKILESSMDHEVFDVQRISASALGITDVRLKKVLKMLLENGYVSGFEIKKYIGDPYENVIGLGHPNHLKRSRIPGRKQSHEKGCGISKYHLKTKFIN